MTLAQKYREEGRREGREEGREEGRREGRIARLKESILKVLEVRHGAVPAQLAEGIGAISDAEKLESLLGRAAQCASIEEFTSIP